MRVRLAVAAFLNSVIINMLANMAAGARRINMGILFTNRKYLRMDQKPSLKKKDHFKTEVNNSKVAIVYRN